jgi:hypothetical protein
VNANRWRLSGDGLASGVACRLETRALGTKASRGAESKPRIAEDIDMFRSAIGTYRRS